MKPWKVLDRAPVPGGELTLACRDDVWVIRLNAEELMTSRSHGSEEALAALGCAGLARRTDARVLIGGLGLGYTLRAALDRLGPRATVVVAELSAAVLHWNRELLAPLAGRPLDDPRVRVEVADVADLLAASSEAYDAILLDVDNGPRAVCQPANRRLYSIPGITTATRALRPGGVLVIWSTSPDDAFVQRLRRAGFAAAAHRVAARHDRIPGQGGTKHTLFTVRKRD